MENDAENKGNWRLMREDTHGTEYFVKGDLSEAFAKAEAERFNKKGHKQFFWAELNVPRMVA